MGLGFGFTGRHFPCTVLLFATCLVSTAIHDGARDLPEKGATIAEFQTTRDDTFGQDDQIVDHRAYSKCSESLLWMLSSKSSDHCCFAMVH